jgi:hypothetical protein
MSSQEEEITNGSCHAKCTLAFLEEQVFHMAEQNGDERGKPMFLKRILSGRHNFAFQ